MNILRRDPYLVALLVGIVVPGLLLATAVTMQHRLSLVPCHMCLEQRTALWTAMGLAAIGLLLRRTSVGRAFAIASAGGIAATASIAVHQLGGERHWWVLNTPCASAMPKGGNALENIMRMPFVRCDVPQWSYAGLTMADLNAMACIATALSMLALVVAGEGRRMAASKISRLQTAEES
jgi:disulfide bond formation protein DsbB